MSPPKKKRWRVRVKRLLEDWIEVLATSPEEAEALAKITPNIVHVFPQMTMSGEKPIEGMIPPVGVEDVDEV